MKSRTDRFPGALRHHLYQETTMKNIMFAALCAILASCGPNSGTFGLPVSDGTTVAISCTLDAQCPSMLPMCWNGTCTGACNSDAKCPASLSFKGMPGCNIPEERCRDRCNSNADCQSIMKCDLTIHFCVLGSAGCNTDCGVSCSVKCGINHTCSSGLDCLNNYCDLGTCGHRDGLPCSANSDCKSGLCVGGVCQSQSGGCQNGQTLCGNTCVNLLTDSANCGVCGRVCAGGQSCVGGACGGNCQGTQCGNACVNLSSDFNNCGACGRVCAVGQSCLNSVCQVVGGNCPQGQMKLNDGSCVPINLACKDGGGGPLPLILSCCDGSKDANETCTDGGGSDCNSYYRCRFAGQGCRVDQDCAQNATNAYPNGLYCPNGTCQPR